MQVTLKIDNPKFFFDALQTIEEIDYECVMRLSDTGCRITGIDPSRIAMFEFQHGKLGEVLPIGIRIGDLSKIISRIKSVKTVTMIVDDKSFKIKANLDGMTKTFTLLPIDTFAETLPIDSLLGLPYQKRLMVNTGEFIKIMKDIELISDTVTIGFRDNKLVYFADSPSSEVKLEMEGYESDDMQSSYSVPLLISKMRGMAGYNASVFFGEDLPIFFNYETEDGFLRIFIAPKVETDEF